MNYSKIYNNLVQSAQLRPDIPFLNGYTEIHHIIPKSMGGSDEKDNLVKLTAREHFVAHHLLWKIYKNKQTAYAFWLMSAVTKENYKVNSRTYESAKKALSFASKGKQVTLEVRKKIRDARAKQIINHSIETRKKISKAHIGKKLSQETRKKISLVQIGRKISEETKKKLSLANKGKKKPKRTAEHIEKIAAKHRGKVSKKKGKMFFYKYSVDIINNVYNDWKSKLYTRPQIAKKYNCPLCMVQTFIKKYLKINNLT